MGDDHGICDGASLGKVSGKVLLLAHLGLPEQVELLMFTDLSHVVVMAVPTPLQRLRLQAAK